MGGAVMDQLLPWLGPLLAAVALAHTIHSNRSKAHTDKVVKIEDSIKEANARIDKVEDRTAAIEATVAHLPDIQMTHRLELAIAEMGTELKVLGERIKPVAAVSARLQEAILERVNV